MIVIRYYRSPLIDSRYKVASKKENEFLHRNNLFISEVATHIAGYRVILEFLYGSTKV